MGFCQVCVPEYLWGFEKYVYLNIMRIGNVCKPEYMYV